MKWSVVDICNTEILEWNNWNLLALTGDITEQNRAEKIEMNVQSEQSSVKLLQTLDRSLREGLSYQYKQVQLTIS